MEQAMRLNPQSSGSYRVVPGEIRRGIVMHHDTSRLRLLVDFATLTVCVSAQMVLADAKVLERYIGNWDIRSNTLQPQASTASYQETYEWVLGRKFIRGETGRKQDGSFDIVFGTYDANADGYPFWIFSSSGSYLYLPPAEWNEREQAMDWKNPSGLDINYRSRCRFPSNDRRECYMLVKDWKGKVILEMEWTAERRSD